MEIIRKRKIIIRILFISVMIYIVYIFLNLDVSDPPEEADVIIVLEGGLDDRARKGVELLQNDYSRADRIIVSPRENSENFDTADSYLDAGATIDQLIFEYDSTSTWTNAINSLVIMDKRNYNSALVVTTDFHTRRSKLSFERVNDQENYNFDLTYIASDPVEDSILITEQTFIETCKIRIEETFKYFGYLFKLYHWF